MRVPRSVQQILRREVSYGCPVEGCRQAFLTWHHFDPPRRVRQHNDPKGMIALCHQHHDFADAGGFSKEELHALKAGNYSTDSVMAKFPWAKKALLIRLGGCYSGGSSAVLSVSDEPIIQLTKGPHDLLFLSFVLKLPDGTVVARMIDNGFQSDPATLHNLQCKASGTLIKIWFAPRDIGLDLSFRRLTMDELSDILQTDKKRAEESPTGRHAREEMERAMGDLPASFRDLISEGGPRMPAGGEGLPKHIAEAFWSGDPVGSFTKDWASTHCLDDDDKITLLDFANVSVNNAGRHIRIRNGIGEGPGYMVYCAAFDNGGSFNL